MFVYLVILDSADDQIRFEELYYKYRNLMYHIAYQVTKNVEDSEDSVQQAFLYVVENFDKVGPVSDKRTQSFLSIIVEHKALDILRKRRPMIDLETVESEMATYLPDDGDNLTKAMAALPKRNQDILLLHYNNGYSAQEISKMLGMSFAAVRKTLWRTKETLRKQLGKEAVS